MTWGSWCCGVSGDRPSNLLCSTPGTPGSSKLNFTKCNIGKLLRQIVEPFWFWLTFDTETYCTWMSVLMWSVIRQFWSERRMFAAEALVRRDTRRAVPTVLSGFEITEEHCRLSVCLFGWLTDWLHGQSPTGEVDRSSGSQQISQTL